MLFLLQPSVTLRRIGNRSAGIKQRLAATFRLFSRYGFDPGAGGTSHVRDSEFPDRFGMPKISLMKARPRQLVMRADANAAASGCASALKLSPD
jgi:hypothetical protein